MAELITSEWRSGATVSVWLSQEPPLPRPFCQPDTVGTIGPIPVFDTRKSLLLALKYFKK